MKHAKGYVHIYYGDGKGKTSILNGMTIRALGEGFKVCYLRFLKNRLTGELNFFKTMNNDNFELYDFYESSTKFFWEMDDQEKATLQLEINQGVEMLSQFCQLDDINLIVVDELLGCIHNKQLDEQKLINIVKNRKPHIEIAFSGHNLTDNLKAMADLVSNVKLIKHYFYQGVVARKGIEF